MAQGEDARLPRRAMEGFGLGLDPIAVREVDRTKGAEKHGIAAGMVNGYPNLYFYRVGPTGAWVFRVSADGSMAAGIHARPHSGFSLVPQAQLAGELKTEEAFWLDWLAAIERVPTKTASGDADR